MYGFVVATDSNGDLLPGRPPDDSQKTFVVPAFHVGLTLDSPPLPKVPGNIRLFGSLDYFATFPPERFAANEASPSGFFIRERSDVVPDVPEEAIEGQGSQTQMQTGRHAYGATVGLSFPLPFEIFGLKVHVRPGASWMRYKWEMTGVILEAIKVEPGPMMVSGREFRGVELQARGKLYSNGVGPYLGVELEPYRIGPTMISIYAEGAYYRVIGDRTLNITTTQTFTDSIPRLPSPETYQGRWGANVSRGFWRAGVGVRLYLAPTQRR